MQTAILKLHGCDFSVISFIEWIADALRTIGARVDWLILRPVTRVYIHYDDQPLVDFCHSVFSITSRSGDQFIADFTVEQFGYLEEDWFMPKAEYINTHTTGEWRIASEDDQELTRYHVSSENTLLALKTLIDLICNQMDWRVYGTVSVTDRMAWVREQTQEFRQRWMTDSSVQEITAATVQAVAACPTRL
jgi:hypothetical protein